MLMLTAFWPERASRIAGSGCWKKNGCSHRLIGCGIIEFNLLTIFLLYSWDTAGQERFKCMAASYYRGAHGKFVISVLIASSQYV